LENFLDNFVQKMDIYLLIYAGIGFVLGLFFKKAAKLFLFIILLLLIAVIYNHYSISQDDMNHIMVLINNMVQKVTFFIKYIYNILTISKVTAIIIGFFFSLLIT